MGKDSAGHDAGYVWFVGALHKDELQHAEAVRRFESARVRLTHNYVLAEFIPLATVRGFRRDHAIKFCRRLLNSPEVATTWVSEGLHGQALDLLVARPDKTYSVCDAVSFLLMRQHGLYEALTTDRHFEQEGFQRLLS